MKSSVRIALVSGFVAGIVTVVACGQIRHAAASPADCASWELAKIPSLPGENFTYTDFEGKSQVGGAQILPPGWEPFMADQYGMYMRRCKP
jgi:hypothetical protein